MRSKGGGRTSERWRDRERHHGACRTVGLRVLGRHAWIAAASLLLLPLDAASLYALHLSRSARLPCLGIKSPGHHRKDLLAWYELTLVLLGKHFSSSSRITAAVLLPFPSIRSTPTSSTSLHDAHLSLWAAEDNNCSLNSRHGSGLDIAGECCCTMV
jgi:hypothetical protein